MKCSPQRLIGEITFSVAILTLLLSAATARAQTLNRPPTDPGTRPREEARPASIEERQFRMMEMEKEAARPRSEEEQKLALAQVAEDYREIQVINNKMMGASIPSAAPNFQMIARTLDQIRKRAIRLKDNLRLAELKEKPATEKFKPAQTTPELKSHLLALDNSIMRLVKNPIFKNPDVVNVDEAAKARGELEFIIVTSPLISKDAERLNKSADKSP
jgi:hypothetical protein